MPNYEYACKSCGEHLEVHQKFTDDALTECPACGGVLRKVFGNVGIAFKGSGFYKTDSRGTAKSTSSSSTGDTKSSGDSSSSSSSGDSSTPSTTSATPSGGDSAAKKPKPSSSAAAS
jgi:putative FmdB family regulatory protein